MPNAIFKSSCEQKKKEKKNSKKEKV